jgi:hypothetical protein
MFINSFQNNEVINTTICLDVNFPMPFIVEEMPSWVQVKQT